jgi:DNA mismatch repair protein MSH3
VYDEFEDGFMRAEFETRALHLQPSEVIIAGDLTHATKKVLSHLSINTYFPPTLHRPNTRNSYTETIRTEYVKRPKTTDLATSQIKSFYTSLTDTPPTTLLDKILSFPRLTLLSLTALITYTQDFGLQNVFTSKYFQHFSSRAHMLLNGSTISSLEIYRNQTDFSEKGSLLWVLDHTRTKFGRRMLWKWIGRPLLAKRYVPILECC